MYRRHEYLGITENLKRVSELARLSHIISRLRQSEDLDSNERNWLAEYLHPWYLMLGRRQNVISQLIDNPLWDLIQKPGYLPENKERLDNLCLQLDNAELDASSKAFALELATFFRHELL